MRDVRYEGLWPLTIEASSIFRYTVNEREGVRHNFMPDQPIDTKTMANAQDAITEESAESIGYPESDFIFEDSFDNVRTIKELGVEDRWMGRQLVRGDLHVTDVVSHSGRNALYAHADNNVGKAHLFKGGYWVDEGDFVSARAQFWFPESADLDNVYIMDWETKSAWSSKNAAANPQPGIRIGLFDDGHIAVERGKMGIALGQDFIARDVVVPRGEWVEIEWRMRVGLGDQGATQVLLNDELVIDAVGDTYIDPGVAAEQGVILNRDYAFDRFKVGLTANSSSGDVEIAIDDIQTHFWDSAGATPDWF